MIKKFNLNNVGVYTCIGEDDWIVYTADSYVTGNFNLVFFFMCLNFRATIKVN